MVVLSLLDSELFERKAWAGFVDGGNSVDRDLPDRRYRKHWRRLVVIGLHQTRLVNKSRPQDRDVGLCNCGSANCFHALREESVDCGFPVWARRGRASRMVGKHLHHIQRYVPAPRGWL